jgi:hypothetical protein
VVEYAARRQGAALKTLALCLLTCLALAGCLTPRSVVLGQTAAPVGAGATEVGLSTGFAYQSQTAPSYWVKDSTGTVDLRAEPLARGFSLPAFEANGQIGVSDLVAVNLHASPAGIQPGAKLTLINGFGQLALLPEIAIGYGSVANSIYQSGQDGIQKEVSPTMTNSLNFLGGLKVIASHRVGVYGALGYDFQYQNSVTESVIGLGSSASTTRTSASTVQHNLTGAIGFDWAMGQVHLRPELAAAITVGIATSSVTGSSAAVENQGGLGFLIMPTLTLAVASDPKRDETGVIEDDKNIGNTHGEREEVPPTQDEERERKARKKAPPPEERQEDPQPEERREE